MDSPQTTSPAPAATPAAKPNPVFAFIADHWTLALAIGAAIALFLFLPSFQEMAYGAIRLGVVALVGFILIHLVFKSTLRPYINTGNFAKDFEALSPQHKTWLTVAVIALVLLIATECFTHAAAPDYEAMQCQRWEDAQIRPEKAHFVDALAIRIERNQARYQSVADATGVPWQVIACLHNMECGQSFRENLANGDPLTARTRHVPAGRPPAGRAPFSWEAAAADALCFDKLDRRPWTSAGGLLQNIEGYNGTGYERFHPDVPTPYLWSWTNLYTRGKYVEDGRWDPLAISQQCGVAPILRKLLVN